jgi:hypothetical protein
VLGGKCPPETVADAFLMCKIRQMPIDRYAAEQLLLFAADEDNNVISH